MRRGAGPRRPPHAGAPTRAAALEQVQIGSSKSAAPPLAALRWTVASSVVNPIPTQLDGLSVMAITVPARAHSCSTGGVRRVGRRSRWHKGFIAAMLQHLSSGRQRGYGSGGESATQIRHDTPDEDMV